MTNPSVPRHQHKNTVQALSWSPNGHFVASASRDQTVRVFDIRAMKELRVLKGHKKEVCCECFRPPGTNIINITHPLTLSHQPSPGTPFTPSSSRAAQKGQSCTGTSATRTPFPPPPPPPPLHPHRPQSNPARSSPKHTTPTSGPSPSTHSDTSSSAPQTITPPASGPASAPATPPPSSPEAERSPQRSSTPAKTRRKRRRWFPGSTQTTPPPTRGGAPARRTKVHPRLDGRSRTPRSRSRRVPSMTSYPAYQDSVLISGGSS